MKKTQNDPIACVVLALESWNYCFRDKGPKIELIHKIVQSSSQSLTIYINEKLDAATLY